MRLKLILIVGVLILFGCRERSPQTQTSRVDENPEESDAPELVLQKVWETDTLLRIPESVLYDPVREVFYVTNINGRSDDKDGNGFISRISNQGEILDLQWITGLNAPKGMGIWENSLFLTDIDRLVEVNLEKEEIVKEYPVQGAQFLNDVSISSSGEVYFSDTRANRIYQMTDGEVSTWLEGSGLNGPNGLLVEKDRMFVASRGGNNMKVISLTDKEVNVILDSIQGGDGIDNFGENYLYSNWNGEVYWIIPEWRKIKILDTREEKINAADIDYEPSLKLLLVPTFMGNRLVAYRIKEKS